MTTDGDMNTWTRSRTRNIAGVAAAITMTAVLVGLASPHPARASADDLALNGTYIATSNGDWARTNDSYHDEQTVRSTWTITSTCTETYVCTGQVTSDHGWTAPLQWDSAQWVVQRDIPGWQPCPDGTAVTGHQTYRFSPLDASGNVQYGSPTLGGEDKTVGPSGACGINKWLAVRMPFRLNKVV